MQGAFQSWHGMMFLSKVNLNHNPLREIEDSHFYRLPSVEFLDLSSTEITPGIVQKLLKISLKLKTLVLPRKMSYNLRKIMGSIGVLHKTTKLDCTKNCHLNIIDYEKEELWGTVQDEVMKAGNRKQFASLRKLIPDEFVTTTQSVENLMENLDTLANLQQVDHKTKIAESEEEDQELQVKLENLLTYLILESKSRIPTDNSEMFNEVLPDKALCHEKHCEHQDQTTSVPLSLDFLSDSDDSDLFEAALNRLLAFLIPNDLIRNISSQMILHFVFVKLVVLYGSEQEASKLG
ncbi:leucine-rich repeat-containing protein 37A3-like [Thamnophis elegans]|uniref:leucine-rich repeat-containing protein 37A3-like n=1 Tax=Thamnophis elegans TaxID=35005 RepID=UPI0013785BF7|nr:leucine-rich repeat-containing protein 37A3-like [Thamnophis elegans]